MSQNSPKTVRPFFHHPNTPNFTTKHHPRNTCPLTRTKQMQIQTNKCKFTPNKSSSISICTIFRAGSEFRTPKCVFIIFFLFFNCFCIFLFFGFSSPLSCLSGFWITQVGIIWVGLPSHDRQFAVAARPPGPAAAHSPLAAISHSRARPPPVRRLSADRLPAPETLRIPLSGVGPPDVCPLPVSRRLPARSPVPSPFAPGRVLRFRPLLPALQYPLYLSLFSQLYSLYMYPIVSLCPPRVSRVSKGCIFCQRDPEPKKMGRRLSAGWWV